MSMVTDFTETKTVNICAVTADSRSRLNASVWQALAAAERFHDEHNIGVVYITDETDSTIVMSWRNWRRATALIRDLQDELEALKEEKP